MISSYGNNLKLSIYGASHDPQIGVTMEGIPAGLPLDIDLLQIFLARRAPGQYPWSSPRKEGDVPHFLSGIQDGKTNGEMIHAVIYNENVRKKDYDDLHLRPRPGHADLTAWAKYGNDFDMSGGGPFSGRMTAPLCIAGGLCKQWLCAMGIHIQAQILQIGSLHAKNCSDFDEQWKAAVIEIGSQGDSIGGRIGCTVSGLPVGLGGPLFEGVEGHLASILFAIPAVKNVGFGESDGFRNMTGSESNDPICLKNGTPFTETNHCGGILGGITNGMDLLLDVTIKPTPSISMPQKTVDLRTNEEVTIHIQGRHDPCIVPRALPVVEAAVAIALYDLILGGT